MTRRRRPLPAEDRGTADLELFPSPPEPTRDPAAAASARTPRGAVSEPARSLEQTVPGASAASAVSVSTLTGVAKDVLEGAFVPLWVRGEVTDFKAHRNGHWYFCLRDDTAQVKCVVWSRDQRRLVAAPDDGMQIAALGQMTVYAARGDLQLSVKAIEAQGDGLWRKAMRIALARLEADGLLAVERKRPLPRFPRRLALVTSPDGAALHDVVAVARRRCPSLEVVVAAAKVQGDDAPEELCAALDRVLRWGAADVVIIGRGGGGGEDLWAFNDEAVARAVAACPVPIVSAVGHEVDVTLCDLVADHRAATPSAAAEAVAPVRAELLAELRARGAALAHAGESRLERARRELAQAAAHVADVSRRATERRRGTVATAAARLHALSPLATVARGYAVARDPEGRTLTAVRAFARGAPFELLLSDGRVRATVTDVEPDTSPRGSRGESRGRATT